MIDEGKISKEDYNHLIPRASITPRIYSTPKIHKTGTPLRPIVEGHLQPLKSFGGDNKTPSRPNRTALQKPKAIGTGIKFPQDEILIFHVVSLFTKTSVDVTLTV